MSRTYTAVLAVVLSTVAVPSPPTRADAPDEGKVHSGEMVNICCVSGGPTPSGKAAGLEQKAWFRSGDGIGVENASVSVSNNSAPQSGPFKSNGSGEVTVDLNHGSLVSVHLDATDVSVGLYFTEVHWPLGVTIGRERATQAEPQHGPLATILSIRGGPNKTPEGPSTQRIRVLNRDGKGIEGVTVDVSNAKGKWAKSLHTDQNGDVSVPVAGKDFQGVSIYRSPPYWVSLGAGAGRWPLEVTFMTDKTKFD